MDDDRGHELRMQVGQTSMAFSDAIDDETIASLDESGETIRRTAEAFKERGLARPVILGVLLSICLNALDYSYPSEEDA